MKADAMYVGPAEEPDRYELSAGPIGHGGEGTVYRATSNKGTATCAIKICDTSSWTESELTHFSSKLSALRHLSHTNLVHIRDHFIGGPMSRGSQLQTTVFNSNETDRSAPARSQSTDKAPRSLYIVMQYVEGPTLTQWVDDNRGASIRERLRILLGVASALDAMHAGGMRAGYGEALVHNDVKPENILVSGTSPNLTGILSDFGLARFPSEAELRRGQTHRYADPEGNAGRPDRDRFAFFATVYHVLTGNPPPLDVGGRHPDIHAMAAHLRASEVFAEYPDTSETLASALTAPTASRPTDLMAWISEMLSVSTTSVVQMGAQVPQRSAYSARPENVPRQSRGSGRRSKARRRLVALFAVTIAGTSLAVWKVPAVGDPVRRAADSAFGTDFGARDLLADETTTDQPTSDPPTATSDVKSTGSSPSVRETPKATPTNDPPPPPPDAEVSWTFASSMGQEGDIIEVSYTTKYLTAGRTLVLERAQGTAGVFQEVEKLSQPSGSISVRLPIPGRHLYRLAVYENGAIDASAEQTVTSYGTVSLAKLLEGANSDSINVGGRLFHFVYSDGNCFLSCDGWMEVLKINSTSCRSLHLDAASIPGRDPARPVLTIAQDAADQVARQLPPEQVVSVDATILGKAFQIFWNEPTERGAMVYLNGSASCWTANGRTK